MADRQHGAVRDRGSAARGHTRMRMDDPSFNNSKRKREEEGDPVLHLLSLVLRIGDRLRVSNSQLLFRTVSLVYICRPINLSTTDLSKTCVLSSMK